MALGLMVAAALLRSPVLALFPQITHWTYNLGILFWCLAYGIFLVHYTGPLLSPRVDGQDGYPAVRRPKPEARSHSR